MAKTSAASSSSSSSVDVIFPDDLVFLDDQAESTDLSYWEFVNQSDADSDTDSLHSVENGFLAWFSLKQKKSSESSPETQIRDTHLEVEGDGGEEDVVDQVNFSEQSPVDEDQVYYFTASDLVPPLRNYQSYDLDGGDGDENDEDNDGYGLDDELVPWNVSGKLGRQRMRKLGKRAFAKMENSKRNPYRFVKAGCVRGKHGLGIKA